MAGAGDDALGRAGQRGHAAADARCARDPGVPILAAALAGAARTSPPQVPADAIRAWDRLGYPRRAIRLHAAAVAITERHGGAVPDSVEVLLELPGVGEYTARAVAAFAFGRRVAVVDTNVRRVLSRAIRGVDEPGASATAVDRALMSTLLPAEPATAARFSIAVMELGALRCTASAPSCALPDRPAMRMARGGSAGRDRAAPVQRWHGTDRQVRAGSWRCCASATGPSTSTTSGTPPRTRRRSTGAFGRSSPTVSSVARGPSSSRCPAEPIVGRASAVAGSQGRCDHAAVYPPSSTWTLPVAAAARSDSRYATRCATSARVTRRPMGCDPPSERPPRRRRP